MIYDISIPVSPSLPAFPGDPPFRMERVSGIAGGDPANVSELSLSSHCGTHIDAPLHFDDKGLPVDRLPLEQLIGPAVVADLRGTIAIGPETLARIPLAGVKRLLLRTDNSLLWKRHGFQEDYAYLTEEGALFLLENKIVLIGIDYLSIERFGGNGDVHRLLLSNGVIILEGLNLDGIDQGDYELICLPLRIAGGDGAPVRAILRDRTKAAAKVPFDPHTSKWPLA